MNLWYKLDGEMKDIILSALNAWHEDTLNAVHLFLEGETQHWVDTFELISTRNEKENYFVDFLSTIGLPVELVRLGSYEHYIIIDDPYKDPSYFYDFVDDFLV